VPNSFISVNKLITQHGRTKSIESEKEFGVFKDNCIKAMTLDNRNQSPYKEDNLSKVN